MSSYQFTPQAVADLFEIWGFIAQDNSTAADRVEEAVFRACDFLAD
jgi:plasmid stabilization system protein ParE